MCDLGRGAYGVVEKMKHIPSGTVMAVKVLKLCRLYKNCNVNFKI